jgi:hypothetical protein
MILFQAGRVNPGYPTWLSDHHGRSSAQQPQVLVIFSVAK